MATTGTITMAWTFTGGPSGNRTGNFTVPITAGVDQTQVVALSSGANTITTPSGAMCCLIFGPNATQPAPNPASTVTLTLKGVTGDTGISLSGTNPTFIPFGTLPATFCITASGSATVEIIFV